jgi:hypothetical protein
MKYMLDWPLVPNIWLVKIGTNVLKEHVCVLKGVEFELHQREALFHCLRFSTIATMLKNRVVLDCSSL